jgi:hypothetical protein
MAYVRWSEESDVYVYSSSGGIVAYGRTHDALVCCGCAFNHKGDGEFPADFVVDEKPSLNNRRKYLRVMYDTMIGHLEAHREAGHKVPQYAIDYLTEERDEVE